MTDDTQEKHEQNSFSTLGLKVELLQAVATMGFSQMTPVQAVTLPMILGGHDVIAQAKTGSGKTVAFALGVLEKIDPQISGVQALVICPTRELADQVCKEIRKLGRCLNNLKVLSLCGGTSLAPQLASLSYGAHIVVGTPGRIEDHLSRKSLSLVGLKILVLDEADRMLDMGFSEAMAHVTSRCPVVRQTLLFSATISDEVRQLSTEFQTVAKQVTIDHSLEGQSIKQLFYKVKRSDQFETLLAILQDQQADSSIIFCETKIRSQEIADQLSELGIKALAIHGDLEQKDRNIVLARFANKSCSVLVATDVAARGLDIDDLALVINLSVPKDPEVYIHRIGRTGRAGKNGVAVTLVDEANGRKLETLQDYLKRSIHCETYKRLSIEGDLFDVPQMITLCINGGRKNKLRPGDILGGLTGAGKLAAEDVGKINIFDYYSYVAIRRGLHEEVLKKMGSKDIKGRNFKIMVID
jgi:ATP-independent RNA helicase DbpA